MKTGINDNHSSNYYPRKVLELLTYFFQPEWKNIVLNTCFGIKLIVFDWQVNRFLYFAEQLIKQYENVLAKNKLQ